MSSIEYPYHAYVHAGGRVLTRRRILSLFRSNGLSAENLRIRPHARSGRNRIFVVDGPAGKSWIAKQNLIIPEPEAWFYLHHAAAFGSAPSCLVTKPDSGTVVTEYRKDAVTLDRLLRAEARHALTKLPELASLLSRLHSLDTSQSDPPTVQVPFPSLDPVDVCFWTTSSPAARSVIQHLQARPRLSAVFQRALRGFGPKGLVHGDLKLDNILLTADKYLIIDWESCGRGPTAWDLGSILGSVLMLWVDSLTQAMRSARGRRHGVHLLNLAEVHAAVQKFMMAYLENAACVPIPIPDRCAVGEHAAAWMVGRSWAESAQLYRSSPEFPMRLLVAEALADDPSQLFGDFDW